MQISQKSYTPTNVAGAAKLLQPQLMTLPEPKENTFQLPVISSPGLLNKIHHTRQDESIHPGRLPALSMREFCGVFLLHIIIRLYCG